MTRSQRPEDLYRPPPPEPPADDSSEGDEPAPVEPAPVEIATVKRRSRVVVITVIAVSATLLIGATLAIVLLATGLITLLGDRDEPASPERPAVIEPAPEDPVVRGEECGELCAALSDEIGMTAQTWTVQGAWSDAVAEVGARDAATAVFASDAGTATLTVLQFDTDEQAAQAVIDLAARIGGPVYQTTVFDDGSGTRYDYDGALISRVLWHLDAQSDPHEPGRLYLVEAPANDAEDFSGQAAFQLYLALPI